MVMAVIEHIEHPLAKGDLTTDGIQWSNEHATSTDDFEEVESAVITPPALGDVLELEFGLTCAVKSTGVNESVFFKWQARNQGGTWVDMHEEKTYPADASAYKEYTCSGRFKPVADFDRVPFEIRLVIKSAGAGGENAVGKTKNSSYVRVVYSAS
jgi:hypothetical protein